MEQSYETEKADLRELYNRAVALEAYRGDSALELISVEVNNTYMAKCNGDYHDRGKGRPKGCAIYSR